MLLSMPHRLVLHIIPLNSFLNRKRHRYNLDGFLTYRADRETELCDSYCQVFFDGTIEAVYANILRIRDGRKPGGHDTVFIAGVAYEKYVVEVVSRYFESP